MRKVIALGLVLAVQAGAAAAPLVHAHPDEHATAHHPGHVVHSHWAAHRSHQATPTGPSLEDTDHDRAVYVNVFVAVSSTTFWIAGLTGTVFQLPQPAERTAHRRIDVVRSHDPPSFNPLSPRAPPLALS